MDSELLFFVVHAVVHAGIEFVDAIKLAHCTTGFERGADASDFAARRKALV